MACHRPKTSLPGQPTAGLSEVFKPGIQLGGSRPVTGGMAAVVWSSEISTGEWNDNRLLQ